MHIVIKLEYNRTSLNSPLDQPSYGEGDERGSRGRGRGAGEHSGAGVHRANFPFNLFFSVMADCYILFLSLLSPVRRDFKNLFRMVENTQNSAYFAPNLRIAAGLLWGNKKWEPQYKGQDRMVEHFCNKIS